MSAPPLPRDWSVLPTNMERVFPDRRELIASYPGAVRESIARLSDQELNEMPREDLVELIVLSGLTTTVGESESHLSSLSVSELHRLALLVRRCCRNQMNAFHRMVNRPLHCPEAI